ncbi:MAG: hypothetical protein ACIAS6_02400 [Phycisphaerales bacterium JB060]
MRCPRCQYALWNLTEPTCPECGRGFELGEWDFSGCDARFACAACGDRLPGTTPRALPLACPACGEAVDARAAPVVPGESGDGVPRVGDPDRLTRIGGVFCTTLMVLSVCFGALVLIGASRGGGHGVGMLLLFASIGTMAGFAGVWPRGDRRRAALVFSLLGFMVVGSFVAISVRNRHRGQWAAMLKYSTVARGIIQAVEIHRQQNGSFPSDPQVLVDHGFIPIELFYERGASVPQRLTWTQLPDGWLEVGMFRIDWDEASWLGQSSFSANPTPVVITTPTQKLPGASVGFADMHVEYYSWGTWPTTVRQLNADRAAAGRPPIPDAALPRPP